MRQIFCKILLATIFFIGLAVRPRADVLDKWTTNQVTTNSFGFHHIVFGNGLYIAVGEAGDSGGFYTSGDGLHWMFQYSEPNSWGVTLNYSGGHFAGVCIGLGSGVADVSSDGTNWTTTLFLINGAPAFTPVAITYGNGLYAIVGSTNNVASILTSPDGDTWTLRQAGTSPGGPINSVTYGGNRFVAVGNNDGLEYTSVGFSAGTTWTRRSIPGGNKISYGNGLFFVPLNNKTNLISVDGINWSLNSTGLTNVLGAVTYGNGLFMAQCGISISGSYLATSTDGTNWIQYAKPLPNSWTWFDSSDFDVSLATDGTRLVTVGATGIGVFNGFIYTSDVLVGVRMTNNPSPKIALSGLVGRNYQIQSADVLTAGSNNWRTNATLQLTDTPYTWTDATATNSVRFYRGVLLP
jgi:hypothetical protein